ncbi:ExbD/TolR family protein [Flavihumibacter profundi]|uniref:ExbD/TolR family protein n=1 Tax=Flavihumibacter profundi TaxID=2716883 RepID=UPI001CC711EB|nr:biopolymer transporter ExbD [Flavihumibacter profundi]MBZ5857458.1 biopolymer transporter ExbD [Flavihumibacter profundi]
MAEIINNTPSGGKQGSIARLKKNSTKVDLTPMVDLGFLLITFFIFSTTMQQQKALRFYLPAGGTPSKVGESTSLTLVPSENDKVYFYHGSLPNALQSNQFGSIGFGLSDGVGQLIREKKKALRLLGKEKDLTIIIYPDKSSSYKNLVDLLDEMLINDVRKYCVAEDNNAIANLTFAIKDAGK